MVLSDYLATILKRWVSIIAITLVVFGISAAYTYTAQKIYTANTQSFVALSGSDAAGSSASSGAAFAAARVKSYTEIVGSPEVLEPVIQELNLPYTSTQLSRKVSAVNLPSTVLLVVTANDPSALQAAQIANAVSVQLGRTIERLETPTAESVSPVKVTLTEPAVPPSAPSSPRTPINLALGLILGLGLGLAWALLRETLDNSISGPTELEALTEAPSLGAVVAMDDSENRALAALGATNVKSEGYRTVRANLQFVSVDDPLRAIVVTSPNQGDGKTTLACNLAIAVAQSGKSVCIVEADLRRPRIAEYFDIDGSLGLTDVLAGQRSLEETIQPWGRGLISILPPGPTPPNPSELLGSHQMQTVLSDLKERFDLVILDSSPVLAVADAAVLAAHADGAILVVRHGRSTKEDVVRAVSALEQVNAKLLGTVLNAVPAKRRYGYGYGYGYGQGEGDEKNKTKRKVKKKKESDQADSATPSATSSST
jgi:capsular exopolysaccharide synthesis family protein